MSKNTNKFASPKEKNPASDILSASVKGFVLLLILFTALLFACSAFAMQTRDPDSLCTCLGYGTAAVSLFGAGIASAVFSQNNKLLCSVIVGCAAALTAFIVSLFIGGSESGAVSALYLLFPAVSALGGLAGTPRKNKKKKFSKK